IQSITITAGLRSAIAARASAPVAASITSYPARPRRNRSISLIGSSSSTTSTRLSDTDTDFRSARGSVIKASHCYIAVTVPGEVDPMPWAFAAPLQALPCALRPRHPWLARCREGPRHGSISRATSRLFAPRVLAAQIHGQRGLGCERAAGRELGRSGHEQIASGRNEIRHDDARAGKHRRERLAIRAPAVADRAPSARGGRGIARRGDVARRHEPLLADERRAAGAHDVTREIDLFHASVDAHERVLDPELSPRALRERLEARDGNDRPPRGEREPLHDRCGDPNAGERAGPAAEHERIEIR